jgi:uncharacterized membrane protein YbhN (UPF0104 family)
VLGRAGPHLVTGEHHTGRRALRWFSWVVGLAMLAAVIIAARHFSEERALVRITERSQPWWLAIAVVVQAGTYLAQGETWRFATHKERRRAPA